MPSNIPALCLGGNVFGWTADQQQSFAVLDAARDAGITFIDTADSYSAWAHGGRGGQSEEILGRWMADRSIRGEILLASKVGKLDELHDIRPATVRRAADASLTRLRTDHIDLYYAHEDDGGDLADALGAFDALVKEGKIRMVGISNFSSKRLREALDICARDGLTAPVALQPSYSLMDRSFEDEQSGIAAEAGLAVMPYAALAGGFLTGKYRPDSAPVDSARASGASAYLDEPRGPAVLAALDAAAEAHQVPVASVALAWLRAQPTVVSPIASARTLEQVAPLAASLDLALTRDEIDALGTSSRQL